MALSCCALPLPIQVQRPTIDEIMRMPQVRSKLQYLPLELQRMADEQQVCRTVMLASERHMLRLIC